jgi:hypothetical protein
MPAALFWARWVGALGTREIPQHAFVVRTILTLASAVAFMLTAKGW